MDMQKSADVLKLEDRLAFNERWSRRINRISIGFVVTCASMLISLLMVETTGLKQDVSAFWLRSFGVDWDAFAFPFMITFGVTVILVAVVLVMAAENFRRGTDHLRATAGCLMIAESAHRLGIEYQRSRTKPA